jgi:DNA-binding HxlR family transcriptional regulator
MERVSFARMDCPIARAVDEVADGWALMILREAYKGAATFSEFEETLPIAPTTLTRKLELLTERGLFAKRTYQDNPPRERYDLTEKALDLLPVLVALGAWGNRWLAPDGEARSFVDARTGKPVDVVVIDGRTSQPVVAGSVALKAGPAASKRTRELLKNRVVLGAVSRDS